MRVILLIMIGLSMLQAEYIRDNANEVVLDTSTKLIWQDNNESKSLTKTWLEAIEYCEVLDFADKNDWRLPNFNELYYLADRTKYNPAISSEFVNVTPSSYWTSTTYASNTSNAWGVNFYRGYDHNPDETRSYYVRCVRASDN